MVGLFLLGRLGLCRLDWVGITRICFGHLCWLCLDTTDLGGLELLFVSLGLQCLKSVDLG